MIVAIIYFFGIFFLQLELISRIKMLRVCSHRAKATSLRWVLSISIVLFTLSKSDIANEWVPGPF